MSNEIAQFLSIIRNFTNENNEERKNAENHYKTIDVDYRIVLLLKSIAEVQDLHIKKTCSLTLKSEFVPFRKKIIQTKGFEFAKNTLPQLIFSEVDFSTKKSLILALSALIDVYIDEAGNNLWQDIIVFEGQFLSSNDPQQRLIGLTILNYCSNIFGENIDKYVSNLVQILIDGFNAAVEHEKLAIISIEVYSILCSKCFKSESRKKLKDCVPALLKVIHYFLKTPNYDKVLPELNDMLEYFPGVFKNHVPQTMTFLVETIYRTDLSVEIKDDVFECVIVFLESLPKLISKLCAPLISQIITYTLNMIADIKDEDIQEWLQDYDEEDEDLNESRSLVGEIMMDRIANSVGGEPLFNIIMQNVGQCLQSQNWKYNAAGVITLGASAEGCLVQFKKYLPDVVNSVVPHLHNSNPKVVYSAINTIGQLFIDFKGTMHKKYHSQIFPSIFKVSESNPYIKIQSQATLAFVNICDGLNKSLHSTYIPSMVQILHKLLTQSTSALNNPAYMMLYETVVIAIHAVAGIMKENFLGVSSNFTQVIINCLEYFCSVKNVKLISTSLETVVKILYVCGAASPQNYKEATMNYLSFFSKLVQTNKEYDDYKLKYLKMISTFSQVGLDIIDQKLSELVPIILNYLQDGIVTNNGGDSNIPVEYTSDYKMGDYRTAITEEKEVICEIISELSSNLGARLSPYTENIFLCLLVIFNGDIEPQLKCCILEVFQPLLTTILTNRPLVQSLWNKAYVAFMTNMVTDNLNSYFSETIEYFTECFTILGSDALNHEQLQVLGKVFVDKIKLMKERKFSAFDGDLTMDFHEMIVDDEDEGDDSLHNLKRKRELIFELIISSILNCSNVLASAYKQNFVCVFELYYPLLVDILQTETNTSLINLAFCLIDDIIEFIPSLFFNIGSTVIPYYFKFLTHQEPEIRQSVIYGIGLMVQLRNTELTNNLKNVIPVLLTHINDINSKDVINSGATANAIATYGKFLKYGMEIFPSPLDEMKRFLSFLPVTEDEVDFIVSFALEMLEAQFQSLFPQNQTEAVKLIHSIILMLIDSEEETWKIGCVFLSKIQNYVPNVMNDALSSLDEYSKKTFDKRASLNMN